jgi:hypothetical protein
MKLKYPVAQIDGMQLIIVKMRAHGLNRGLGCKPWAGL